MNTKIAFLNCSTLKLAEIQSLVSQCVKNKVTVKYCRYKDMEFYIAFFADQTDARKVYESYDYLEIENTGSYLDLRYINHDKYELIDEETNEDDYKSLIERAFDSEEEMDDELAEALIDVSDDNYKHIDGKSEIRTTQDERVDGNSSNVEVTSDDYSDEKITKKERSWKDRIKKRIEERRKEKTENDFTPDLCDERFVDVYENNDYNIDLTNYAYKANPRLKDLVREKRRRRNE